MIRFERDTLDDMKPAFMQWREKDWCDCADDGHDECYCYGGDEWDNLDAVIVNDNGTIACHTSYGNNKGGREHRFIILPERRDLEPDDPYLEPYDDGFVWEYGEIFIVVGDMCWEGDDVDYNAPVLYYFMDLLKRKAYHAPTKED